LRRIIPNPTLAAPQWQAQAWRRRVPTRAIEPH
jgi:hypothetical protein